MAMTHSIERARYRALRVFADNSGVRSLRDYAVAFEPEPHSPGAHAVADRLLRGLFLMLDLRPDTLPIRVVHATWSGLGIFLSPSPVRSFFKQALD